MPDVENPLKPRKNKQKWIGVHGPEIRFAYLVQIEYYFKQESGDVKEDNETPENMKLGPEDTKIFLSHMGTDFEDWLKEEFSWWEIKKIYFKAWWKARKYKKQWRKERKS